MALFDIAIDYSRDVFRNIRGLNDSQHVFDDLSDDPADWEAANAIDVYTHPLLINAPLIQRAFDYSQNDFIGYPFEHITVSRYNDGSAACWYGGETLATTIYETQYHFIQEILNAREVFNTQKTITIDRRVAIVHCHGLAFDLSQKANDFPWLVDAINYTRCQEIGRRVAQEGYPLLRVPSARHKGGINVVVFKQHMLSNVREYCNLHYVYDVIAEQIRVYKGEVEVNLALINEYD
jgi:hypothetical protein